MVVVAATKMDKLARTKRGLALRTAEKSLGLEPGSAEPFSAEEGTGTDALWARINRLSGAGPDEAGAG
jgi:GTP-binding protein